MLRVHGQSVDSRSDVRFETIPLDSNMTTTEAKEMPHQEVNRTQSVRKFLQAALDFISNKYDTMTARVHNGKTDKKIEDAPDEDSTCCCRPKTCSILLLIISFLMTGIAILIFTRFESFFDGALRDQVHLGPHGVIFPSWRVPELRMNMRVYFFNITNPEEVMLGDKPIVKEIGPYTWRIFMEKLDIKFHSNYTLSYREKKWYQFSRADSVGSYDDVISTINVPYAAVAQRFKDGSTFAKSSATFTLNTLGQKVIHSRKVGELTFEGYPDFLILVANAVENKDGESGIGSFLGSGLRILSGVLTDDDVEGKFGYFVDRNNTDDGVMTMFTGEDERRKINRVDVANGKSVLTTWPSERCNRIKGTMGHMRQPMSGEKPLTLFVPELCRSLPLRYARTGMYDGLSTLRFVAGADTFNNTGPDACFAGPKKFKNGIMDIGPCKKNAPLIISFPHYLYADDSHIDSVVGMNPNPEKHQFYIENDPLTGITVSVRARLQVGVVMQRVHGLGDLGTVFEGNIPLFWQELQLEALPPTVFQLSFLRNLPSYMKSTSIVLVFVAISLGLLAVFLAYRDWRGGRQMRVAPERALTIDRAYTNHVYENQDESSRQKFPNHLPLQSRFHDVQKPMSS